MKNNLPLTFRFIEEIQDMHDELSYLREEVKRLKEIENKHNQFVQDSIRNSHEEMNNWMQL